MVSIKQIYEAAVIRELRNSPSTPFRQPKETPAVKHHNLLSTILKGQIPEAPSPQERRTSSKLKHDMYYPITVSPMLGERKMKKVQKVYAGAPRQVLGKTPRRLISIMDSDALIENIERQQSQLVVND